jgi:hypothetical protein
VPAKRSGARAAKLRARGGGGDSSSAARAARNFLLPFSPPAVEWRARSFPEPPGTPRARAAEQSGQSERLSQLTLHASPACLAEMDSLMAKPGTISVGFVDGAGNEWDGPRVTVILRDPFAGSLNKVIANETTEKGKSAVMLTGVPADAGQRYVLSVDASGHRSHSFFPVKPRPNTVVIKRMMLVRNDPQPDFSGFNFARLAAESPEFHRAFSKTIKEEGFLGLATSDEEFGSVRMAALLNFEAKLRALTLRQGNGASYVLGVENIDCCERDRLKAFVKPEMPEHVKELDNFGQLSTALNKKNHPDHPVGFKEQVDFASLQLSFAELPVRPFPEEPGVSALSSDIDIDFFTDLGHVGEVIKNKITKSKTDPYDVYVKLFDQNIRPLYALKV